MTIKNCKSCGKIFNSIIATDKICPTCKQADSENFKKVRDYLYKNKGANIPTVSEETQVPTKDIIRYLREDRLEVSDNSELGIPCEHCGTNIKSGRFCSKCMIEMQSALQNSVKSNSSTSKPSIPKSKTTSSKMFTANFRKNR